MRKPRYFLILARGFCGSLWLAAQFDRHPEISCTGNLFVGLAVPHGKGPWGNRDRQELRALSEKYLEEGVDSHFDRVARRKRASILGDVHGFRVLTYRQALAAREHRPAAVGHLVRHPVTLLERLLDESLHLAEVSATRQAMIDALPDAVDRLRPLLTGIDWQIREFRDAAFLNAAVDLATTAWEVRTGAEMRIPLWSFEQLTSDSAAFSSLVAFVSGGTVAADERYLGEVFSPANLENSGRYRNTGIDRKTSPADIFARWKPQERRLFQRLVADFDFATFYRPVGYSFDFAEAVAMA